MEVFLLRLLAAAVLLLAVEHVIKASTVSLSCLKPVQIALLAVLGVLVATLFFSPADVLWLIAVLAILSLGLLRWTLH